MLKKRTTWVERSVAALLISLFSFLVGRYTWTNSNPKPLQGFLMKSGNQYVVAWKPLDLPVEISFHDSLNSAIRFAESELQLHSGFNPKTALSVEHSWLRSQNGQYTLYWKNWESSGLNRLTFGSEGDAFFFYNAFRSGAYTGSPVGHAISLIPFHSKY